MPDTPQPLPAAKASRGPARSAAGQGGSPALSAPQKALRKLGLLRDIDLALHLPLRYEDETRIVPIASLRDGMLAQVQGTVTSSRIEVKSRRQLLVELEDDSGAALLLRFLHFYPSNQKTLSVGALVRVRGEVRVGFFGREMVHPVFKSVQADSPLPQALTPVYPSSAQLPQVYLRKAVASALGRADLRELLPPGSLPAGLPPLREALQTLHQPAPGTDLQALEDHEHPAWQRLKFDELLAQQISQLQAQAERALLAAPVMAPVGGALRERLLATLPFALTGAQQRVVAEIAADLARGQPMHRLLQGDVGSGKTVVAALAAATAIDAGWQCALMAPTEILAEQHFNKLLGWLQPLGVGVAWLTGSRKGRARNEALARVASGEAALVVGTHAVIQDDVVFARLGLAVVDEQHRFGVAQRLALRRKLESAQPPAQPGGPVQPPPGRPKAAEPPRGVASTAAQPLAQPGGPVQPPPGRPKAAEPPRGVASTAAQPPAQPGGPVLEPHLLMMSATPIPRTLAMSYYADLDVSTIDELPPGRTPIVTKLFADSRRGDVVARIGRELASGRTRQVYWVCPLVEESEHLDLQNATATHAELSAALAPAAQVGLLHGRMKAAEKAAVMGEFAAGRLHVLVATTVIEVGVDVPAASLMVIEHAERFGLAQLHQLRGRVGRGAAASACVLLYTPPLSPTGKSRLQAMVETTDGFEIARRDLEIRGPGEFMGARQSGDALLKFADLAADGALLQQARVLAPRLLREHPQAAAAQVQRWLASKAEYLKA